MAQDGDYVLWLSEDEDAKINRDLSFINRDDNPNACYYDILNVVALKDVHQGEKLIIIMNSNIQNKADWN